MEEDGFIFGCYIYPNYASTINHAFPAIGQCSHGDAILVAGYFNVDLVEPKVNRSGKDIVAEIVNAGLEDISVHFLP